jgi:hypothetical protein
VVLFFEVRAMADSTDATTALATAAITAQFPGLPEELVATLTPEQMEILAKAVAPPPAEEAAAPMEETPPRDTMLADLLAMGHEQAELDALDDESLYQLWMTEKGQMMSEESAATPAPAAPAPTPAAAPTSSASGSLPAATPSKVTLQYAERRLKALERRIATREQAEARLTAETNRQSILAFCERMVRERHLTSAQAEHDKQGKPVGPTAKFLHGMSAVRKFSDRPSDLENAMAEIEARPLVRDYSEKVGAGASSHDDDLSPEKRRELLGYYRAGRAILRDEDAAARKNGHAGRN